MKQPKTLAYPLSSRNQKTNPKHTNSFYEFNLRIQPTLCTERLYQNLITYIPPKTIVAYLLGTKSNLAYPLETEKLN